MLHPCPVSSFVPAIGKSNWLSFFIFKQELDYVVEELEKIAVVNLLKTRSIISLIGNVQRSSLILEKVCVILSPFE